MLYYGIALCRHRLVWSRTQAFQAWYPGSNPGGGTRILLPGFEGRSGRPPGVLAQRSEANKLKQIPVAVPKNSACLRVLFLFTER